MPSSATITTFYTMVAGTKARASQVNANFDNFRGHLLPIDPNTAASVDATYDLGAPDARFRNLYLKNPPYVNGVQTSKFEIETVYDGSVPCDVVDDIGWLGHMRFMAATSTSVRFQFRVPNDYSVGNRISLNIQGYCETQGANSFVFETQAALYRAGLDDASLTSPANVLTSTSAVFANTTTSGRLFNDTSLRLTDSTGKINSNTIQAGDLIAVDLKRRGTHTSDTNTGYVHLTTIVVDLNN